MSIFYLQNQLVDYDQSCMVHFERGKNWLGFGDLDPIFEVTGNKKCHFLPNKRLSALLWTF